MLVGVYGTLRRKGGNHYIIEHTKYIGTYAVHNAKLYGKGKPFPFMVLNGSKTDTVVIEVYDVKDRDTFHRLCHLEGVPYLYQMAKVRVEYLQTDVLCFVVSTVPRGYEVIQSGDWLKGNT